MHDGLRSKLAIYGQRTYVAAWALEIAASILGLTTGIALGIQAFNIANADTPGSATSTDLILASAPFFMVAIAELTKIPIATLLYTASWYWKPIVSIFLVALAGITFETVFMGLERQVSLRQLHYDEIVNKIDALASEYKSVASQLADTTLADRLKETQTNLNSVATQAEREHNNLAEEISDAERDLQGQRVLTPDSAQLRDRISEKRGELDNTKTERELQIKNQMAEFEGQRESFVKRIGEATKNGDIVRKKQYGDELDRLLNPRSRLEAQYAAKTDPIERDIASMEVDFNQKQKNAPTMSPAERQGLEAKLDALKSSQE